MPEWKYQYETQEQLKLLFSHLAEKPLEVSLHLQPTAPPDFWNAWNALARFDSREPKDEEREIVMTALEHYQTIARRERIHPFALCKFSDIYGYKPKIESCIPFEDFFRYFDGKNSMEIDAFLTRENWRYRRVDFCDMDEAVHIRGIKKFVEKEIPERYHINSFFMKLNPKYSTSDHYYTSESNEGVMYTDRGNIVVIRLNVDPVQRHQEEAPPSLDTSVLEALRMRDVGLKLLTE